MGKARSHSDMGKARSHVLGSVAQRRNGANYLATPENISSLENLQDEAVTGGSSDSELVERFLQQCQKGITSYAKKPQQISNALLKNRHYRILDIEQVETCYGDKQVWTLGEVDGEAIHKVYGSAGLTSFTKSSKGGLDDYKVSLMKKIHVEYCGTEGMLGGVPTRYLFKYHLPK